MKNSEQTSSAEKKSCKQTANLTYKKMFNFISKQINENKNTYQIGKFQKNNKNSVLARLWGKTGTHTLLLKVKAWAAQSCLPLCSPPSSSVHGILQGRILEWVVIPFSRGSSWPRDWNPGLLHCRQIVYLLSHHRSPHGCWEGAFVKLLGEDSLIWNKMSIPLDPGFRLLRKNIRWYTKVVISKLCS